MVWDLLILIGIGWVVFKLLKSEFGEAVLKQGREKVKEKLGNGLDEKEFSYRTIPRASRPPPKLQPQASTSAFPFTTAPKSNASGSNIRHIPKTKSTRVPFSKGYGWRFGEEADGNGNRAPVSKDVGKWNRNPFPKAPTPMTPGAEETFKPFVPPRSHFKPPPPPRFMRQSEQGSQSGSRPQSQMGSNVGSETRTLPGSFAGFESEYDLDIDEGEKLNIPERTPSPIIPIEGQEGKVVVEDSEASKKKKKRKSKGKGKEVEVEQMDVDEEGGKTERRAGEGKGKKRKMDEEEGPEEENKNDREVKKGNKSTGTPFPNKLKGTKRPGSPLESRSVSEASSEENRQKPTTSVLHEKPIKRKNSRKEKKRQKVEEARNEGGLKRRKDEKEESEEEEEGRKKRVKNRGADEEKTKGVNKRRRDVHDDEVEDEDEDENSPAKRGKYSSDESASEEDAEGSEDEEMQVESSPVPEVAVGRKPGEEWEDGGVRWRVDFDGKVKRRIRVRRRELVDKQSSQPKRNPDGTFDMMLIITEEWVTQEEYDKKVKEGKVVGIDDKHIFERGSIWKSRDGIEGEFSSFDVQKHSDDLISNYSLSLASPAQQHILTPNGRMKLSKSTKLNLPSSITSTPQASPMRKSKLNISTPLGVMAGGQIREFGRGSMVTEKTGSARRTSRTMTWDDGEELPEMTNGKVENDSVETVKIGLTSEKDKEVEKEDGKIRLSDLVDKSKEGGEKEKKEEKPVEKKVETPAPAPAAGTVVSGGSIFKIPPLPSSTEAPKPVMTLPSSQVSNSDTLKTTGTSSSKVSVTPTVFKVPEIPKHVPSPNPAPKQTATLAPSGFSSKPTAAADSGTFKFQVPSSTPTAPTAGFGSKASETSSTATPIFGTGLNFKPVDLKSQAPSALTGFGSKPSESGTSAATSTPVFNFGKETSQNTVASSAPPLSSNTSIFAKNSTTTEKSKDNLGGFTSNTSAISSSPFESSSSKATEPKTTASLSFSGTGFKPSETKTPDAAPSFTGFDSKSQESALGTTPSTSGGFGSAFGESSVKSSESSKVPEKPSASKPSENLGFTFSLTPPDNTNNTSGGFNWPSNSTTGAFGTKTLESKTTGSTPSVVDSFKTPDTNSQALPSTPSIGDSASNSGLFTPVAPPRFSFQSPAPPTFGGFGSNGSKASAADKPSFGSFGSLGGINTSSSFGLNPTSNTSSFSAFGKTGVSAMGTGFSGSGSNNSTTPTFSGFGPKPQDTASTGFTFSATSATSSSPSAFGNAINNPGSTTSTSDPKPTSSQEK